MSEPRIAVYCSTRNGYTHMSTAAKSLLAHNGADYVYFLTEDDTYPEQLPQCVTCLNVSGQDFFTPDGPNYSTQWTWMVLMRTALSQIFTGYDRVLSLDTDTIVTGNIDGLWRTDLTGKYLAAVPELFGGPREYPVKPYHNCGVMLMNLRMLRENGMDQRIISAINTTDYPYNEQDAINILCHGHIGMLQEEYNAMPGNKPEVPVGKERIRHFIFDKPLMNHELYRRFRRMSWEEVMNRKEAAT